jgi:hypothetical protein
MLPPGLELSEVNCLRNRGENLKAKENRSICSTD